MPAEFAGGAFEDYAGTLYGQRRHRIGLGAPRIKGAGAGESGDANFPFHFAVIGLEVGVGDGPIAQVGARDGADFAALDEIDFVEAPKIGGEVHAGATDTTAINEGALRLGFFVWRFAEGSGLQLWLVGEQILVEDFYFVVDEVGFGEVRALLEDDDAEAVGGKCLGNDPASSPGADNNEIDFVGRFVSRQIGLHALVFPASGGLGCQPA